MTPEERAYASASVDAVPAPDPTRHLSPLRVLALLTVLAAVAAGIVGLRSAARTAADAKEPLSAFMPYVDVTATPQYAFEDSAVATNADLVLGFVVSAKDDPCAPSWGAAYTPDQAENQLDLDRRIARVRQRGGEVTVSFGGQANSELAARCTDPAKLAAAYGSIVRRYHLTSIDLDVEGAAASAPAAAQRRATAIATVQRAQRQAGHPLAVWLTLPVDPSGLTAAGRAVLQDTLAAKVSLGGVNAMTMDYGSSLPAGRSLVAAAQSALTHLHAQLQSAYRTAGLTVSAAGAWQRLGATPMIGQNDVPAERFGLADAKSLLAYANRVHLRRLSMWSMNRDQACGPNYADVTIVSDNCSGVSQPVNGFTSVFRHFTSSSPAAAGTARPSGSPAPSASTGPSADASTGPSAIVDDPATSPYPIWSPALPYTQGTKIVWHRNVYQAKWWTKGDTPDAPVAAASESPWTLLGPVLPGEHPKPTPTLSAGTYPAWSASATYQAGARVLYQGVGYQAKWYSHGDVPGVVVADPGQTPWEYITGR